MLKEKYLCPNCARMMGYTLITRKKSPGGVCEGKLLRFAGCSGPLFLTQKDTEEKTSTKTRDKKLDEILFKLGRLEDWLDMLLAEIEVKVSDLHNLRFPTEDQEKR